MSRTGAASGGTTSYPMRARCARALFWSTPNGAAFLANSGRFVALRRVCNGARPFSAALRIGRTSSVWYESIGRH